MPPPGVTTSIKEENPRARSTRWSVASFRTPGGVIQGNVSAGDKVELKAGGKLFGDVKAPRILIADGASFKGNINMGG